MYSSGAESVRFPVEPILKIENLSIYVEKEQKRHTLVHDLSVSIHQGETLALVGESGSGKSVTANGILGLMPKSLHIWEGKIWFRGEDLAPLTEEKRRRIRGKQMSCVFQDYQGSFTPFMTLGAQLVETICCHENLSYQQAKALALEWIEQVGLPGERVFTSYPFQLSGGQQQRVALAAAMMLSPTLLIADEPTTALDVVTGERILDLLAKLQRQTHCAVLLISHDLRHVLKRADRIAVMQYGKIVEIGRAEKIKYEASHPYTKMLLQAKPSLAEVNGNITDRQVMPLALGRGEIGMKELLKVNGLYKTYRESGSMVEAVQDVSLSIGEGECLGLLGESGSGKSTLARLLLLIESPDRGDIQLQGQSLLALKSSALRKARKDFQVVFQDPTASLNQRLPIWQSIMEPLDNFPEVTPPFLTDVRHCRKETAVKLLEMVGLKADHIVRYPHELSGGQLQRVAIARGISLMPKLLICDEATASLDVSVQAQILQLLKKLKSELQMSYLFISHDIIAVRMMSDRILVMKEGRIVDRFPSHEIMSPDRHPYTKQLVSIVT